MALAQRHLHPVQVVSAAARMLGALLLLLVAVRAHAGDTWSDPFPGVRYLERTTAAPQRVFALELDLCRPGVSIRATRPAEKGQTVPAFGSATGVTAAVNGDFYRSGYVPVGLAVGAGERWPGTADTGVHGTLAFGDRRVVVSRAVDLLEPPPADIVNAVGGVPDIVWQGGVTTDAGSLCGVRHPRTAVGVSQDRRKLIVVVVDGRSSQSIGMTCAELGTLLADLGAYDAINLDGGGSTTMWLSDRGVVNAPSDGSPRVVANHLGIVATGSGDAPLCPNREPVGHLDGASCDAVSGWAQDPDVPDTAISVHLYFGGPAGDPAATGIPVVADANRPDLCTAIGSCNHGFDLPTPSQFLDGLEHSVYAYGIDSAGGNNPLLAGSPMTFSCAAKPRDGGAAAVDSTPVAGDGREGLPPDAAGNASLSGGCGCSARTEDGGSGSAGLGVVLLALGFLRARGTAQRTRAERYRGTRS